jgi:hypothetical protein
VRPIGRSSRSTTNEEPRHVFREAGLKILRLIPSRAGPIYEALTSLHVRALCVEAARPIGINSPELDCQAMPLLSGGG